MEKTEAQLSLDPRSAEFYGYNKRVWLRGYTRSATVLNALTPADRAAILRKVLPAWPKELVVELAQYHRDKVKELEEAWNAAFAAATQETFGRKPEFTDYKITAIGREEFSEAAKTELRRCGYGTTHHKHIAEALEYAAAWYFRKKKAA